MVREEWMTSEECIVRETWMVRENKYTVKIMTNR